MTWKLSNNPRDWQKIAIQSWIENKHRGIAKVVTGGGKTFFAMMCIKELAEEKKELRFLIVVPTLALRDQWTLDLIDDLGVNREEIYSHGMDNSILPQHRIVLIVINSARKYSSEFTQKGQWMLIVDECHRAASEENRKAMIGSWVATLGLSATPERQYDDWFNEYLIPKLGIVIAEYDYVKAKKDNVIVDFELMNYKVPLTNEESQDINNLTRSIAIERNAMLKSGEMESQKLLNLSMKRSRISQRAENRVPLAISICDKFRDRRVLIFHEYTAIADQITRILDERGHRVASYHSKIGDDLRFDNLRMFREGVIDILVTCKALDEGLNVPDTSVGIIVASTKSVRQRIQRMGRILRTSEGKEIGTIVTLYTHVEKMMLEAESESLDEISQIQWFGGD